MVERIRRILLLLYGPEMFPPNFWFYTEEIPISTVFNLFYLVPFLKSSFPKDTWPNRLIYSIKRCSMSTRFIANKLTSWKKYEEEDTTVMPTQEVMNIYSIFCEILNQITKNRWLLNIRLNLLETISMKHRQLIHV